MSNVTIDAEKPPAATATEEDRGKAEEASNGGKTSKKAQAAKKAKPPRKTAAKTAAERANKKAEVIALMKRAKGAPVAEIIGATKIPDTKYEEGKRLLDAPKPCH